MTTIEMDNSELSPENRASFVAYLEDYLEDEIGEEVEIRQAAVSRARFTDLAHENYDLHRLINDAWDEWCGSDAWVTP